MNFFSVIFEPAIIIITLFFIFFVVTVIRNYMIVDKNLKSIYLALRGLNKKELSYRFNELDSFMSKNPYVSNTWEDFKKALIFPEKIIVANNLQANNNEFKPEIYLTIDASYFFNEETLVYSQINHKFIQIMPTLLTGLGPFFTFLKMAVAFTKVNFVAEADIGSSLNGLIGSIQIAALCSVFAVGFSLLFMFLEKNLYNKMCKHYYLSIQNEFIRLFDVVTSEKFLIDLVKESKIQNMNSVKLLKDLPDNFAKSIEKTFGETAVPYLENILYSLNKLNESVGKGSGGDVVDKLF